MNSLEDLIGKTVEAAYKSPDGDIHLVFLDGDEAYLQPEGDCCANCWIADVDGADALMAATVTAVETLEVPAPEQEPYEVLDAWGHRIITTRGICTIGMRVSHNGYYGGWLNVRDCTGMPDGCVPLEDFS